MIFGVKPRNGSETGEDILVTIEKQIYPDSHGEGLSSAVPYQREDASRAKGIYRKFSRTERSLPIFFRDWWLDAAAGPDAWNVAVVMRDGEVAAAMPYVSRRKYGMRVISQPPLTPMLGPWLRPGSGKSATRLASEKSMMYSLIEQLPAFDHFMQNWYHEHTNWLPFYWKNFRQTTRYTYQLEDIRDIDKVWNGFQHSTRGECGKAANRFKLQLRDDLQLDDFLELNRMTFAKQGLSVPYSDAFVHRLDAACRERGCRKFWIAVDPQGRHHSGFYIVWDETSVYGLMNGTNPELRFSGGISLCFWEAIKYASTIAQKIDFSGSMMQPVERFLRGFGANQVPYFRVTKTPSILLRMQQGLSFAIRGS